MPEHPGPKRKAQKKPRFNYAVETEVDRTVREQNRFLEHCQINRVELTVFAITGASFNGIVHQFDRETILFGGSGKNAMPRLILKTFVAMIIAREAINLFLEYKGLGTARTKNRKKRFIEAVEKMGEGATAVEVAHPAASESHPLAQAQLATRKRAAKKQGMVLESAVVTTKPARRTSPNC